MDDVKAGDRIKTIELLLLGLFVFVLPSLETPKIIFWSMYVLAYLVRRYLEHGFSISRPDSITLSVVSLFLVSLVSTMANWPLEKSFSGSFDTLSFCALFLCLYHGGYSGKQIKLVAFVMLAGALAGLLFGLSEYTSGISSSLSFHSAGVTTQSSIYLAITILTAFGFQTDATENPLLVTALISISLFLMGVALLYMGSRGAIFAVFSCLIVVLALNRSKRLYISSVMLITAVICTAYFLINAYPTNANSPDHKERFSVERFQKSDSERLENWKIALKTISAGDHVFLGIGPRNYRTINPQEVGITSSYYQRTGQMHHAHNLFLTQWVEQGIIGLLVLISFYILVLARLINKWRYCKLNKCQWVWVAALSSLVVPVTAGFFNTPFYQEHAMLAMILMGAMFSETSDTA